MILKKNVRRITFLDSIPKINPSDVQRIQGWRLKKSFIPKINPSDDVQRIKAKTTLQGMNPNEEYASFLSYVQHIKKISDSGVPFKLYALENVPSPEVQERSSCRITELRARTNIVGTLYIKYGLDQSFKFINHIGIIIYDANTNKIAHRQFYKFKKKSNFR